MPLPTGTTGSTGRSRSEAAIEAWKHRQRAAPKTAGGLDPKIAARVKEILASKVKGKKKAKGGKPKAAAKPKLSDAEKQTAKDQKKTEADTAKAAERGKNLTKVGDDTDLGDHLANMDKFKQGKGIKEKDAAELEKRGLVERGSDGTPRLSSAGNAVLAAAARGDSQGAKDAASRGRDAAAGKQERDKAKVERVAAQASKQQATLKKQKQATQAQKEKAKASAGAKQAAEKNKAEKVGQAAQAKDAAAKEKADAPAKKQTENRAKVAKDMADQDAGLNATASAALGDFADGKPLDEKTATQFEAMGLTEKGSDGQHRLTADGKAAAAAMSKGDTRAAIDAISRAADKKKASGDSPNTDKEKTAQEKTDREQGDLLASVADNPKKLGFRQAGDLERAGLIEKTKDGYQLTDKGKTKIATRQKDIDAAKKAIDMTELAIKAGARHSRTDMQHLQGIHDSAVACGASCDTEGDDSADVPTDDEEEGVKAIKGIMDNPLYYAQHECGDIMQAANALSTMAMLIQSELMEDDEDPAHVAMLCDAAHTLVDFIDSELDELEGASKDAAHDAGMGPMNKGIELATLDDGEQVSIVHGYSVKSLNDDGLVGGYLVKFGGEGDLSTTHDIFTKNTNYGSHTKSAVWVHHRMLPGVGKRQLTNEAELGMDDEGVFVKHLLDLRNVYEAKLYDMAKNNKLGWSSGTAPNLVERKALGDGRHEIVQWPLGLDASYTPMPAGGFVVNASAMKSLFEDAGIDLLNAIYIDDSPEAIKSTSMRHDDAEMDNETRARMLLLELDLLELETA